MLAIQKCDILFLFIVSKKRTVAQEETEMILKIKSISLKNLLIVSFVISVFLAVCLLLFSVAVYFNAITSSTSQTSELYASEQSKLLSDELQSIKTSLYSLWGKTEVQDYLVKNQGYRASVVKHVQSSLNDVSSYVSCIEDVSLTTQDGHTLHSYSRSDFDSFLQQEVLLKTVKQQYTNEIIHHTVSPNTSTDYFFTLSVPFRHLGQTGVITAFSTIKSLFENLSFSQADYALYHEGRLIYSNSQQSPSVAQMQKIAILQQQDIWGEWLYLVIDDIGWELLIESPVDTQNNIFRSTILRWILFALLVFAIINFGLMYAIFRTIVDPISQISQQSQKISSASMQLPSLSSEHTELNMLVDNINAMIQRTNQLTAEVHAAKFRMMELEIANLEARNMFLQVQINPHFLYNTLECICGMAAQKGDYSMREMVYSLSRLYRYCLNAPESTLGEEAESIRLYERIIRQRYQSGYRLDINISDELTLLPLPRMTLEPLVENAFQHGFIHGDEKKFVVSIHAELEHNHLTLIITDNGPGIQETQMMQLQKRLETVSCSEITQAERIGMFNVAARIKMTYGSSSGLYLSRNEQGGLTVRIVVIYPLEDADAYTS